MGYLHLTAMGAENIAQFDRFYRAFHDRKGLVIDVRGNGGGWVEYFVIDKLQRKLTAFNVLKNMEPFAYPPGASKARFALLTNEYNGSDGEAFVEHFKAAKLGTVIGVPSWGGLVGIVNGQPTVDGGTVHQSNNSFYGRDGIVARREPRRRPRRPPRERPRLGLRRQGPPAREGGRGAEEGDRREAVHLPGETGLPGEVGRPHFGGGGGARAPPSLPGFLFRLPRGAPRP
ncbi:MAG: hypothetical protein IPF66_25575 [Holophagales bacterium]|nr:hypothetical protein [Holophagales bacterium]